MNAFSITILSNLYCRRISCFTHSTSKHSMPTSFSETSWDYFIGFVINIRWFHMGFQSLANMLRVEEEIIKFHHAMPDHCNVTYFTGPFSFSALHSSVLFFTFEPSRPRDTMLPIGCCHGITMAMKSEWTLFGLCL